MNMSSTPATGHPSPAVGSAHAAAIALAGVAASLAQAQQQAQDDGATATGDAPRDTIVIGQRATHLSAFHALEFRLLARPPYIASVKLAGLLPVIRRGLDGAEAITLILGHDTNVAALGGLLGVH
jgi:hypothetical protein